MKIFLTYIFFTLPLFSTAFADEIEIKIDSMSNVKGNGSIEACGSAVHQDGTKPLLVTLEHDKSYYSTLTAPNDKWCILFKRWTFSGNIKVSAVSLNNPGTKSASVEMDLRARTK